MKRALGLAAALLCCVAAHAQTVYRCGPEGRSYSQSPCTQGRAVDVTDDRSAQQRRDATEVAERDKVMAASLEQERLARESRPHAGAGKIDGRIGYAKPGEAGPASNASKKSRKRHPKTPQQAERYKAVSAPRS